MELSEKKLKKLYEKNLKLLNELVKQKGNKCCADCCEKGPKWASTNLGIFLCVKCAGFHRKMGSAVKSITLDNWSQEEIEAIIDNGNDKVNSIYLDGSNKPIEADYEYIKDKYERRVFSKNFSKPKKSDKDSLSILENMGFTRKSLNLRALDLADGNVQDAIELLLSGAVGEAPTPVKSSKGKSKAEAEESPAERTHEFYLPKLPSKKIAAQDSEAESTMSLGSADFIVPDSRKERINDSRDDISNSSRIIQDEKIKQALEKAMEQLASFGFTDVSDTRVALKQARGDVEKALNILVKWKDERIARENIYKQQKQLEETKKDVPSNLSGSLDNISQSGNAPREAFHNPPTHLQSLANQSSLRNQVAQNTFISSQPLDAPPESKLQQNIPFQPNSTVPRFDYQANQLHQQNLNLQQSHNIQQTQPHQNLQHQHAEPLQAPQPMQTAPQVQQQNPIDIFSSDQFIYGPYIQTQPIQPSIKVFDLLGSSSSASYSNPFASKPLLPTVNGLNNENLLPSSVKNDIAKLPKTFSNDLAGLSFNSAPQNVPTTKDARLQPTIPAQTISIQQGKSPKDTIMSLYRAPTTNQSPYTVPPTNQMPINPFMINQQQAMPARSQPRLSLTKSVNSNPFMNSIPNSGATAHNPVNMGNSNQFNYTSTAGVLNVPILPTATAGTPSNIHLGADTGRNYQLDNYSASSFGKSEIFSAPLPPLSEKEKIQASLFSDLGSFRR